MSTAPATAAPHCPPPGWVVAKSIDREALTARAVLTYPCVDQQGDFVRPDGGDWDTLAGRLVVNWWHEFPVGRGSVEFKSLEHGGRRWDVPVGTSRFFKGEADTRGIDLTVYDFAGGVRRKAGAMTPREAVAASRDVWRLVAAEQATGVSVEFHPDPDFTTVTKSGRRYDRWLGRGWAHTPRPVNEWAQLLLPDEPVVAKAVRDGRFADGSPVSPVVLKSLSRLAPPARATITVPRTVRKAMAEIIPPADGEPVADPMPDAAAPEQSDTPPEAAVAFDGAQMIADMATRLRDAAAKTLDDKTHKALMKCADNLEAEVEDLTAIGEGVEAKLAGRGEAKPDAPAEPADPPADDDEPEAKSLPRPLARNADGAIVLKSQYKPRRLKLSDLGEPVGKARPDDERRRARLQRELRDLRRQVR